MGSTAQRGLRTPQNSGYFGHRCKLHGYPAKHQANQGKMNGGYSSGVQFGETQFPPSIVCLAISSGLLPSPPIHLTPEQNKNRPSKPNAAELMQPSDTSTNLNKFFSNNFEKDRRSQTSNQLILRRENVCGNLIFTLYTYQPYSTIVGVWGSYGRNL